MDEKNQEEVKIIKTQDENGEEHEFELLDVFEIGEQEYGMLVHVDETPEDEQEVVIMRIKNEEDGYLFEVIESDEEFDSVLAYLEENELLEVEEETEE